MDKFNKISVHICLTYLFEARPLVSRRPHPSVVFTVCYEVAIVAVTEHGYIIAEKLVAMVHRGYVHRDIIA